MRKPSLSPSLLMRSGRKLSSKNLRAPSSSSGTAANGRARRRLCSASVIAARRPGRRSPFSAPAALEKSRKSGGVIVVRPAVELRPVDRLILSVGKFDRLALGACGAAAEARRDRCSGRARCREPTTRRHCPSLPGFGRDNLPVGIARRNVAREGPHVGDVGDLFGVAVDHGAGAVARRRR